MWIVKVVFLLYQNIISVLIKHVSVHWFDELIKSKQEKKHKELFKSALPSSIEKVKTF